MSAVAKLQALKTPTIPLVTNIPFSEYPTMHMAHTYNAGIHADSHDITNKLDLPYCPDSSDKECLLHTIHEFQDGCIDTWLHVATAHRYTLICEVLGGDLHTTWDTYVTTSANADCTDANWPTHMRTYLCNFLPANMFLLQGEYLNQSIKPKAIDCYTLNSRLGLMNTLSVLLSGSGGNQLLPDTLSRKNMFFKLMLAEWQLKLTSNGIVLDNASYTINQLVDFMEQQCIFGMLNRKPNSVATTTNLGTTTATTAKAMNLDVLDLVRPTTDQAVAPLTPLKVLLALHMGSILVLAFDMVPRALTMHPILVTEDLAQVAHLSVPPITFAIVLHAAVDLPHMALAINFITTQTIIIKNLILPTKTTNISMNILTCLPMTPMPMILIMYLLQHLQLQPRLPKLIMLVTLPKINITRILNNCGMMITIMSLNMTTMLMTIGSKTTDMKHTYHTHTHTHTHTKH